MGKITVIGIGPGESEQMTFKAKEELNKADTIIGYTGYIGLLDDDFSGKEVLSTGMRKEVDRCRLCYEKALEGKNVALVCSGDAGVYGMASLIYELYDEYVSLGANTDTSIEVDANAGAISNSSINAGENNKANIDIEVIAGITAASSGAAVLGAPINHDFCTISLSDLLTPWELIEKRLRSAAAGDFVISLYNPSSHKRADYLKRACEILMETIPNDRPCGYVKNIGREGTSYWTGSLEQLSDEQVDMFTTCFIGNSQSFIEDGKLITPRGYMK